jgi:hypothetical protein
MHTSSSSRAVGAKSGGLLAGLQSIMLVCAELVMSAVQSLSDGARRNYE